VNYFVSLAVMVLFC